MASDGMISWDLGLSGLKPPRYHTQSTDPPWSCWQLAVGWVGNEELFEQGSGERLSTLMVYQKPLRIGQTVWGLNIAWAIHGCCSNRASWGKRKNQQAWAARSGTTSNKQLWDLYLWEMTIKGCNHCNLMCCMFAALPEWQGNLLGNARKSVEIPTV